MEQIFNYWKVNAYTIRKFNESIIGRHIEIRIIQGPRGGGRGEVEILIVQRSNWDVSTFRNR